MLGKLYLDTSIPSAPFDKTKPMRIHITDAWFLNDAQKFELYISTLTVTELNQWTNNEKREKAFQLLSESKVKILEITSEMKDLAALYVEKGAFPIGEMDDALHIACATLNRIPNFASWDFRHIVSVNPILKLREIHQKQALPQLNIGTLGLFGGDVYGTFEPEKFVKEKNKI